QRILATLFRTSLFQRIQARFAEMERTAKASAIDAGTQRATLLGEAGAATPEAAAERAAQHGVAQDEASRAAVLATEGAHTASAELAGGRRNGERLKAAAEAETELAAREEERPAMEVERQRLDAARRAQALAGEEATLRAAQLAAAMAEVRATKAKSAAENAEARLATACQILGDEAVRAAALEEATRQRHDFEQLLLRAATLGESAHTLREAEGALFRARTLREQSRAAHEGTREKARHAAAARQEAAILADQLEPLRAAMVQAALQARDALALRNADQTVRATEQALTKAQGAASTAEEELRRATVARAAADTEAWAAAASELAEHLHEGEPCAVCGSPHHPSPAVPAAQSGEDRAAAAVLEESSRAAHLDTHGKLIHAQAAVQSAQEQLADLASRVAQAGPVAKDAVATTEAAFRAAEAAKSRLPTLNAALTGADAACLAAESALTEQEVAHQQAQAKATSADAAHATRLEGVPPEARDQEALDRSVAAARSELTALTTALTRDREEATAASAALLGARSAAETATGEAAEAQRARTDAEAWLLAACQAADFADLAAHAAARMAPPAMKALATKWETFGQKLEVARAARHSTALDIAGLSTPELPALEAAAAVAQEVARTATELEGAARERATQSAGLLQRIQAADQAYAEARERHALLDNLARQTSGKNARRMDFEGFVLASLLDEALAAANAHLYRMMAGRYRLARRDDPSRGNVAVGLDIEVFDEHTGQPRPAGTLSGGEGFCAALALALGLAETVQAHAGARPVDTLLIDEGFGSLDEEALDKAMEVLSGLHGGSRLVGIISHVPELKTRIPARLEVTPGLRGSTARFVVG
ncbi:MAG: sbcC, partial [Variovorax sp.]|nr:sbcC [Variovorax sp.]